MLKEDKALLYVMNIWKDKELCKKFKIVSIIIYYLFINVDKKDKISKIREIEE